MSVKNVGTHLTHCCSLHGCKYYGNEECPVTNGQDQVYPCERCQSENVILEQMFELQKELNHTLELKKRGMRF